MCENLINTAWGLAVCSNLGKGSTLFMSETNS